MDVIARTLDDLVVLAPAGALDSRSAVDFEKTVLDWLGQGAIRFVIDLGKVDVVSSAGLRVLIMLGKRLAGTEGGLVLSGLSEHVQTVFEVTALADHFTITDSEQDAIARVKAPRGASTPVMSIERRLGQLIARAMAMPDGGLPSPAGASPAPGTTVRALANRIAATLAER